MAEIVSLRYATGELATKANIYIATGIATGASGTEVQVNRVDCEYNYNALDTHITEDIQRWQQVTDGNAAMYALLLGRISQLEQDVNGGAGVQYDMSQGTVIVGNGGLLTLGGGGAYVPTTDGAIICIYSSVLGGLATVSVNDVEVFNSGVSLLADGTPTDPIPVAAGDSITVSGGLSVGGTFNVTFYPVAE